MMKEKNQGYQEGYVKVNSIRRKIMMVLSTITVEPTVFLTISTSMMYQIVVQIFYFDKACRVDIGFNSSICDGMVIGNGFGYSESQEAVVQKTVARMLALRTTIQGLFPPLLLIFIGSWSDRYKRRKPFILIPIIGEISSCLFLLINAIFLHQLPLIFTAISDSAPLALSGGWPSFFLGVYSYVGTISSEENRTIRMSIIAIIQMASYVIGSGLGVILLKMFGYIGFFLICILFMVIAMTFGMYLVKEEIDNKESKKKFQFFKDFFNLRYFVDTFKVCFQRRPDNGRTNVILIMVLSAICSGFVIGDININYLYTKYKFLWSDMEFSIFMGVRFLVSIFATSLFVLVFNKILHIQDVIMAIVGEVTAGIGTLIFAFAPTESYFYIGAFLYAFYCNAYVVLRSLISKLVPTHELAQLNSMYGIIEAFVPMVFGPLFTMLYHYTIDTFPGAAYVFAAVLKLTAIFLFTWIFILMPTKNKNTEVEITNTNSTAPEV